jgi:RNA polymerase sigma-70 factor (ECF subfamily)
MTPTTLTTTARQPTNPALACLPVTVQWDDLLPQRDYLVRFAQRKLQDAALAEDLVHDVFEAVVTGRAVFAGRSALRSWLTAILKHKIVDLIRQRVGTDSLDHVAGDEGDCPSMALPCPQPQPDEWAAQRQTVRQVLQGIAELPDTLREVVQLRILQDQSAAEVCAALSISENNLFQRLYRARQSLCGQFSTALH